MRKLFLTAICILCSHWLWSGEIWVSPKGNDFNDGTRQSPKATLTAALRQAREWRRTGDDRMQGGITVYMEGGTYALYEPVFIRPVIHCWYWIPTRSPSTVPGRNTGNVKSVI